VDADVRAIPQGMRSVTPHIVVRGAARAAEWYASALGAEEHDRLELSGGKLLYAELWFGDSAVRIADDFTEAGVLSPQSIGGTPVVRHLFTEDVAALWKRAVDAGAEILQSASGATSNQGGRRPASRVGAPKAQRPLRASTSRSTSPPSL